MTAKDATDTSIIDSQQTCFREKVILICIQTWYGWSGKDVCAACVDRPIDTDKGNLGSGVQSNVGVQQQACVLLKEDEHAESDIEMLIHGIQSSMTDQGNGLVMHDKETRIDSKKEILHGKPREEGMENYINKGKFKTDDLDGCNANLYFPRSRRCIWNG